MSTKSSPCRSTASVDSRRQGSVAVLSKASLIFFVIAGLTGALYRAGQAYGFTGGFDLINVRHAHSHTMYFGWATPALFLFIGLRSGLGRLRWIMAAVLGAAAPAYILFLLFGYQLVSVGSAAMPISVIAAAANTMVWYVFLVAYFRTLRGRRRGAPGLLWDTALTQLAAAVAVGFWFADSHGLRVLYLHVMLLGLVSGGLAAEARARLHLVSGRSLLWFVAALSVLLLSLVPLAIAPAMHRWMLVLATWIAWLPPAAAVFMLLDRRLPPRDGSIQPNMPAGEASRPPSAASRM